MAQLTGYPQAFEANTDTVDDSPTIEVGSRARDTDGNEYIYLEGVASTGEGSWVSFDENGETALLTADAVGRVAIAMAAIVADKYGWFQVYGKNTVAKTDTVAADKPVYIDGTDGRVDDASVAGDLVFGAYTRSSDDSNVATVEINYPFVADGAYLT